MQSRHIDRFRYFSELRNTTEQYLIPYLSKFTSMTSGTSVLEVGCGEGGNLAPFAKRGCEVTGIDISSKRIHQAQLFFNKERIHGEFIDSDIFLYDFNGKQFDIIICHDVIEHIAAKERLLISLKGYLKTGGIIFIGFPAWQMPFGGHQQICHNKIISISPFIHLLPNFIYRSILTAVGESRDCIEELLEIKSTHITIEQADSIINSSGLTLVNETFWLINPHYKQKFGLKPRELWKCIRHIPYLRNYMTTSYWAILK